MAKCRNRDKHTTKKGLFYCPVVRFPDYLLHKEHIAPSEPPSSSTEKSWPHFRPPPVDFCSPRLALQPNARERWQCRRERPPKPYKRDSSGVAPASSRLCASISFL